MAYGDTRVSRRHGSGILSSIAGAAGTVLNKTIDLLPTELHFPSYQYCGPGTKLAKRLKRGDPGINPLDAACKDHDIAYSQFGDNEHRAVADRVLAEKAGLVEKTAAWAVTNIMKLTSKLGGGGGRNKRRTGKRKPNKSNSVRNKKTYTIQKKGKVCI